MNYETQKTDTPRTNALLNKPYYKDEHLRFYMLEKHAKKLERELNMALDRIRDLLMPEDGHAQREAEKFLEQFKEKNI